MNVIIDHHKQLSSNRPGQLIREKHQLIILKQLIYTLRLSNATHFNISQPEINITGRSSKIAAAILWIVQRL